MWLPVLEEMTLSFSILMQEADKASMQCDQSIKVTLGAVASTRGDPLLRLYLTNSWTAFKHSRRVTLLEPDSSPASLSGASSFRAHVPPVDDIVSLSTIRIRDAFSSLEQGRYYQ